MSSFIDTLLHRELKSGREFEGLIPKSKGTQQYFEAANEYGDTYETLEYMSQWAYTYAHQMKKVAPLLQGATISETVDNIYKWLYNHFQYKIDGQLQHLYAPSAAWENRTTGFDCKTYSLLASTILQCLSIPHAFRKVKQPGMMPDDWTHVYVIVPTQNNKYLIIDATTHNNKEVSFIEKYDHTMKLKHVGLASPAYEGLACPGTECTCGQGLSASGDFDLNSLYTYQGYNPAYGTGLGAGFSIDSIKNLLSSSSIDCLGGSAFNGDLATQDIEALTRRIQGYIDVINNSVVSGNMKTMSDAVNKLIGDATWNASICGYKISEGWNSCSTSNMQTVQTAFNFYRYKVVGALKIWLTQYFDAFPQGAVYYGNPAIVGNTNTKYYTTEGTLKTGTSSFPVVQAYFGEWVSWCSAFLIFEIPYFNYTPKPVNQAITKFEITKPVLDSVNSSTALSAQTVLSSLGTILVAAQTVLSSTGSGSNSGSTTNAGTYDGSTGTYTAPGDKPKPKMAGTGLLVGGVLAYVGYKLVTSNTFKNAK